MNPDYGIRPPAFRLPVATRVGAVHLQVSDLPHSVSYYERVIGLYPQRVTETTAVLSAYDDARPLVTLHSRRGVMAARHGAFGLYHFAILVPDRAALGRFAGHVTSQNVRVGMADHLVSEAIYLWDPDGLGIEVYADRPRETWLRRGRELAMTTDPLDIHDVIAAGHGERWTGAPARTTIGHVHLHVGDLSQAEAFYHYALGFDKVVWSYPGALFMSAGGYHHHLATNTWSSGPAARPDEAQLVEWELVLPTDADVVAVARSLEAAGHDVAETLTGAVVADPWATRVRVLREPSVVSSEA